MKTKFHFNFRGLSLAIILFFVQCVYAQNRTITGTVTDSNQEPLIGVNVTVRGNSGIGTITDIDGKYTLSVPEGKATLGFSYIGYVSQEIPVGTQSVINVVLKEDAQTLDEVVVVGYGTMKKSDLTGSVGSISAEKLAARGSVRLEDALQGSVPGVNTVSYTHLTLPTKA